MLRARANLVGGSAIVAGIQRLARTFVGMADTLTDDFDVMEFMYRLSESCAELLDAAACGVLLVDPGGALQLAAGTSFDMRALEAYQASARQGPGFDAVVSGETVVVDDVRDCSGVWPGFVPRAAGLRYAAVVAQPLAVRDERIGALDVYRHDARPFDDDEIALARGLADLAAIGILNARAHAAAQKQVRDLRQALETRATVEQAKALLSDRLGLSTGDAFDLLRRHARDRNRKLRDVAQRFLDGELSPEDLRPTDP